MENDNEPEMIRQRMEETRTALTEKLERLEGQVTDLVGVGAGAVTETIENVKDTVADVTEAVQEKVQSVKNFFDVRLQVEQHPFLLMGGAVAVGFLVSRVLRSSGNNSGGAVGHAVAAAGHAALAAVPAVTALTSGPAESKPAPEPKPAKESKPKGDSFIGEAFGQVRNLAVGSMMALVREMATVHLPNDFGKQVADTVDGLTQKLGIQPMASPIDLKGEDKPEENETNEEAAKAGRPGRNRKATAGRN